MQQACQTILTRAFLRLSKKCPARWRGMVFWGDYGVSADIAYGDIRPTTA
jgi:hypothetical protein